MQHSSKTTTHGENPEEWVRQDISSVYFKAFHNVSWHGHGALPMPPLHFQNGVAKKCMSLEPLKSRWWQRKFHLRGELQLISSSGLESLRGEDAEAGQHGRDGSDLGATGAQNNPITVPSWCDPLCPFPFWLVGLEKDPRMTLGVTCCKGQSHKREGAWVPGLQENLPIRDTGLDASEKLTFSCIKPLRFWGLCVVATGITSPYTAFAYLGLKSCLLAVWSWKSDLTSLNCGLFQCTKRGLWYVHHNLAGRIK